MLLGIPKELLEEQEFQRIWNSKGITRGIGNSLELLVQKERRYPKLMVVVWYSVVATNRSG
jgi:hypothetical protein